MTTYIESIENISLTLQQIISDNMLLALAARRLNRAKLAAGIGVSGGLISQKLSGLAVGRAARDDARDLRRVTRQHEPSRYVRRLVLFSVPSIFTC